MNYRVYCDESRQVGERFMTLGGLIIPAANLPVFNASMSQFRAEQKMFAELKWQRVSNQKLTQYRRFVDYFFALNTSKQAHFHALIVDTHKVDHRVFNQGDKEIGFYKFYYQLLLHCFGKKYCDDRPDARIHLILDRRNSRYSLEDLRTVLNNGLRSRWGIDTRPFVAIEPCDSKKSEVLQMTDILLGAVGFQKNGFDLIAGSRQAKKELAAHIAKGAGLADLKENTPFRLQRFTLWNFRLKKK